SSSCYNPETSNSCNFTVRSGNIYFVSTGGNNSNPGTVSQPWGDILFAKTQMVPGDTTYVRDGYVQSAADNFAACFHMNNQGGTPGNSEAIVSYPGETATIGTLNGNCPFGIRTHNQTPSEGYWTFAELNIIGDIAIAAIGQQQPLNIAGWRIIGNDFTC